MSLLFRGGFVVIITKEEKEYLESRLTELTAKEFEVNEKMSLNSFKPISFILGSGYDDIPDFDGYADSERLRMEINQVKKVLEDAEVSCVSGDAIGVGSRFVVTSNDLSGETITEKYTLSAGLLVDFGEDDEFGFLSVNSPFGQAVLNKKANDRFSFVTPGKVVISGIINEVINEKNFEDGPKLLVKKDKKY